MLDEAVLGRARLGAAVAMHRRAGCSGSICHKPPRRSNLQAAFNWRAWREEKRRCALQQMCRGVLATFFFPARFCVLEMLLASTLALWPPRSPAPRKSSPRMRLTNEAETCRRVAAMRAIETADGCGAFSDHLASLFAGEEQLERARAFRALQPNPRSQIDAISLRCLAVDDRVLSACRGEARIRQVLCLGCGMDSRPHRLDLPGVAWFEVDVPEVLALKEELLRTASPEAAALTVGRVERLGLDLGRELHALQPALRAVGWEPGAPTLSLLEGVAYYLSEASKYVSK